MRSGYSDLVVKCEGNTSRGRPKTIWNYDTNMNPSITLLKGRELD